MEEQLQQCTKCFNFFPLTKKYFSLRKNKRGIFYFHKQCRLCRYLVQVQIQRRKGILPRPKLDESTRLQRRRASKLKYKLLHPKQKKLKQYDSHVKLYQARLKKKIRMREYIKLYRAKNPSFRIAMSLRTRLNLALRGRKKIGSHIKYLGCKIEDLKLHLESQFKEGMTWNTYGKYGWHVDHKIPISLFNLQDIEQLKSACHFTNLQPMWARENLIKGNKLS